MKFWEKCGVKLAKLSIFLFQKNRIKANYFQITLILITILYISFTASVLINQRKNEQKIDNQTEKIEELSKFIKNNQELTSTEITKDKINQKTVSITISPTKIITPTPTVLEIETGNYLGILEIKSSANINIYDKPTINSDIINTVTPTALLFYIKKEANWYQIVLADQNKNGWVPAELVNEIAY